MIGIIQKYKIVLILVACGLTLFGLAANQPHGFIVFCIPGILLGLLIYLTNFSNKPNSIAKNKSDTSADELLKWHQLKEDGIISDEEFKKKKLEILG
ncbi:SHOCT domain-containing protein [Aliivibrio fischeri]|uniref:SHOCT domain-containing protein n=1 Tax=Aliivibrio fischeri TaxID=668 RepID=UPI00080DCF52|nr:SHOCT domain-containing protein [Aliivibrio fischeri]OCH04923.1 hypothetical protein A6E09_18270 [Aliivibrio fischeri]USR97145.1 SHOCT domain-containing protein [Aliivibrio fischeri ATCC 7744 = JCM 18803 = DSM 507]GGK51176.1 hypothetical protein GCM10007987_37700 [Aliivibrio fischeri]